MASFIGEEILKMKIFDLKKIGFLGFYKAELKPEDIIICNQEGKGFL